MNDPVTIARELLAIDASAIGGNIIVDGVDVLETTCNAQKIARAVLAVAALAEKHEGTARNMGPGSYGGAIAAKIAQDIRAALSGETND